MKYFYPVTAFNSKEIFINTKTRDLMVGGNIYTYKEMERFKNEYNNMNRIYKPFILLLYTDLINGKGSKYSKLVKLD